MGLTHSVRNLVVGSALTAGAMAVMQGVAVADEDATPTTTAEEVEQPPPPRPSGTSASGSVTDQATAPINAAVITTPGPLTRVQTGADLNCAISHAADSTPAFFADTACGTFLAVDGTLFGPDLLRPETTAPKPRSAYTRVRQPAVTGSGSFTDPHKQVTEVGLGATGLSITQTDSYVAGQESYRTDITVANAGPLSRTALLYRAGDCVLGDSDEGFGSVNTVTGAVACVGGEDMGAGFIATPRTQLWYPISPGSHHYEDVYDKVWARIGSQLPFPDLCAVCTTYEDNAAGLSWAITVPAGGSVTRSHLTTFSVLGVMPLTATLSSQSPTAAAGSVATYTIIVDNPNELTVNLNSIVVTLPAGFSYVPGSTSRITNLDPTITGQLLTWRGPIEMNSFNLIALDFSVRVAAVPGDYLNEASADAGPHAVVPGSASITVVAGPDVVVPPVTPTSVGGVGLVRGTANALAPFAPRAALKTPSPAAPGTGDTLPATGSDPRNLLVLATLLLAGGGALVTAGRRQG
jgi:uncharacterized repeat protein (TIGR01451 family)/LPXTG-motif cell wall-anchored protein